MAVELKCDFCNKEIPSANDVLLVRMTEHISFWDFFKMLGAAGGDIEKLELKADPPSEFSKKNDKEYKQVTKVTSWCCRDRVREVLNRLNDVIVEGRDFTAEAFKDANLIGEFRSILQDFEDHPSPDPDITVGRLQAAIRGRFPEMLEEEVSADEEGDNHQPRPDAPGIIGHGL